MSESNTPITDALRDKHTHPAVNDAGERQCVECRERLDPQDGPVWSAWTGDRRETVAETYATVPLVCPDCRAATVSGDVQARLTGF